MNKVKSDDARSVELPVEDMSGELQTIPARHGVATFVPRGRTIKVINTYGKQVVSMWAFSLGAPPENGGDDEEIDEEKVKKEAEGLTKAVEVGAGEEVATDPKEGNKNREQTTKGEDKSKESKTTSEENDNTKEGAEDPPEQAPDAPEDEQSTEKTEAASKQGPKRTWASYLPSIPYRNKGAASKPDAEKKPNAEEEKALNEANTKKWSSYIPTGRSFSSYVPNVQIPDSKEAMSSFKASHHRDPNKSYAEQLYDFSKTPVGAGTFAAATGSGYASSVYAAYSAYASTHPSSSSQPPMEYLSLPHTRASLHKLVPEVDDELLTNLRNPIITFIEDTSPGAHDTLTAACDANQYLALGVDEPEKHGSCAENLVLALKELNETAGLKGAKAIGADISVNIAPTPLHLFMNAPLHFEHADPQGAGALGITLQVEEPVGKKRAYVRFRAERDVVVVLSACPMDVGRQNGGRCMAANFMVEDVTEDMAASAESGGKPQKAPKKLASKEKTAAKVPTVEKEGLSAPEEKREDAQTELPKEDPGKSTEPDKKDKNSPDPEQPQKNLAPKKLAPKTEPAPPMQDAPKQEEQLEESKNDIPEDPKPKKKPRKLQPRTAGASAPPTKT